MKVIRYFYVSPYRNIKKSLHIHSIKGHLPQGRRINERKGKGDAFTDTESIQHIGNKHRMIYKPKPFISACSLPALVIKIATNGKGKIFNKYEVKSKMLGERGL